MANCDGGVTRAASGGSGATGVVAGGAAVCGVARGERGGGVTAGGGGVTDSGFRVGAMGAVGVFGTTGEATEGAVTIGGETGFCSVIAWTGFSATGGSDFAGGDR